MITSVDVHGPVHGPVHAPLGAEPHHVARLAAHLVSDAIVVLVQEAPRAAIAHRNWKSVRRVGEDQVASLKILRRDETSPSLLVVPHIDAEAREARAGALQMRFGVVLGRFHL